MKRFFNSIKDLITGKRLDIAADAYVESRNPKNDEERIQLYRQFWVNMARYKGY